MTSHAASKSVDKNQHNIDGTVLAEYTIHKRIGKGAYGIVYKAYDKGNKQNVAIKKIFDAFRNRTDAQRTYREILFLKSFQRHPNIITMLDIYKAVNNKDLYVVFEFMENDLNKVIRERILKDVHIRFIMFQLCNGLSYIHGCNVMHRDLKPSNILIDKSCSIKIGDLGLARSLNDSEECLTEYIATRWYRAPEILISNRKYTHHVDIWSLGCILAEMLQSKPLFPGASTSHQLQLIVNLIKQSPPHAEKFYVGFKNKPDEAVDLLHKILVLNPSDRPETDKIRNHAYVRKYFPSSAHPIPDMTPHTVVLGIDDNNQLEIDDYQDRLYDIVKRCKRKKSMKKFQDNAQQLKVKDASRAKANGVGKENSQNISNVTSQNSSKTNIEVNDLEDKNLTSTPNYNKSFSTPNFCTHTNEADGQNTLNRKDYISYNKQNIVNYANDKTKARKTQAHPPVAMVLTQDTPVLVTSKTYHIEKDHVKHISKTWLDPTAYEMKKIHVKDRIADNIKNVNNILGKCNNGETVNQPKLNKIACKKIEKVDGSCNKKVSQSMTCEEIETELMRKHYLYSSQLNGDKRTSQDNVKCQSLQDIKQIEKDAQCSQLSKSTFCQSQSHNGVSLNSKTRFSFPLDGSASNNFKGIYVKIPQTLNFDKKNSSLNNSAQVPSAHNNHATRDYSPNKWVETNAGSKRLETPSNFEKLHKHTHNGCDLYRTNKETKTSPDYETMEVYVARNAQKKVNKNPKTAEIPNVTKNYGHNCGIRGYNEKYSASVETLDGKPFKYVGNVVNKKPHKTEHKLETPSGPCETHVPPRQYVGETTIQLCIDRSGRRHSENSLKFTGNVCNGDHTRLESPYSHHNNEHDIYDQSTHQKQFLNEISEKSRYEKLFPNEIPDKSNQKPFPHKNCVFDKLINYYNNTNKNNNFPNHVINKNSQNHKRPNNTNLADTKTYNGSNENVNKYEDKFEDTSSEGNNLFKCFKKNKTKVKKYFDYNNHFNEKLNNMQRLSVLNFDIAPITMDDSDGNEDAEPTNHYNTNSSDHCLNKFNADTNKHIQADRTNHYKTDSSNHYNADLTIHYNGDPSKNINTDLSTHFNSDWSNDYHADSTLPLNGRYTKRVSSIRLLKPDLNEYVTSDLSLQLFVRVVRKSHTFRCARVDPAPKWEVLCHFSPIKKGCRIKVHKDHLNGKEEAIAPCKLHYDPNSAKEMLLLATSNDDQKLWVQRLSKKIQKCGYKANTLSDGVKISPRESTRSVMKPYNLSISQRSATLPTNTSNK